MMLAPIIAMILQLLTGFGGSALASKFGPGVAKAGLKALSPRLAGKALEGTGRGMRALRGGGRFAGSIGGFIGGSTLAEAALGDIHEQGPEYELAPDPTVDDIGRGAMPFLAQEQQGLQRMQVEEQLRVALEQLGIDYDEFMLQQGGIV